LKVLLDDLQGLTGGLAGWVNRTPSLAAMEDSLVQARAAADTVIAEARKAGMKSAVVHQLRATTAADT
jgi:hypothetical protein